MQMIERSAFNLTYPIDLLSRSDYLIFVQYMQEQTYRYHVLDDPEIEDSQYDRYYIRLKEIEGLNPDWVVPLSPTQYVGYKRSLGIPVGLEEETEIWRQRIQSNRH